MTHRRAFKWGRFWSRHRYFGPVIVIIILAAVFSLYGLYRVGLRPVGTSDTAHLFTVSTGQDAPTIAKHLAAAGLIRNRTAFVTYINFHGLRGRLKVGTYLITPIQSGPQIANEIAAGHIYARQLIVPEGDQIAQIEAAAAVLGISQTSFQAALASPHAQSFLAEKPAGVSLEGYLFPDSYSVDTTTTATELVNEMLNNFGQKVGQNYVQAFAAEGLTLHQGLTIASIVEREVADPTARPIVAQIFIKRFKTDMPLGSDVTAEYAANLLGVPFATNVHSPYNTLLAPGLPPGPICSPGLGSLDAVAHPATTNYLYFLTGKDGKTYYATTYAQHQQNIAKYLN